MTRRSSLQDAIAQVAQADLILREGETVTVIEAKHVIVSWDASSSASWGAGRHGPARRGAPIRGAPPALTARDG